jgi:long-chain acyl-CoA synthetase
MTVQGLLSDVLRHTAKLRPLHPAVIDDRRSLDYADVNARAARAANLLAGGLAVAPQERFAVLSENRAEFIELVFGAAMAGCVCVPLNYRLTPRELSEILADAEVRMVFAESQFADAIETVCASGFAGRIVWLDGGARDSDSYDTLLQASSPTAEPRPSAHPSDVVLQMYTSGTTGTPKGVMLSHRNLLACSWSHLAERTVVPEDRYLTTAPLCHLGAASRIWLVAHAGATHVIHRRFDPERVFEAMYGEGVSNSLVVPTMLSRVLDVAAASGRSLKDKVRLLNYGTARMPLDLLTAGLERLRCDFMQGYGLTEASPNLTILPPEDHRPSASGDYSPRLASVGRETVGVHVRVVDSDDQDVAPGQVGEVVAQGANIMEGYWRRPEDTAEALRDGWLRTGDLAVVDDAAYVYLVDRSKDMLISGGINVYPAEVERQLEQHPWVAEAAVVGVADSRWGEVPAAYIVLDQDHSGNDRVEAELTSFMETRLARFKLPKRYEIVSELPRNVVGKVLKHELRRQASQDPTRARS